MNSTHRDFNEIFKKVSIYTMLIIGALFVLLPLFWMIITAMKQPGNAMKIKFIPDREVLTEKYNLPEPEDLAPSLILEYDNPSAPKVTVGGDFNGWNDNSLPMKFRDGVWTIKIKGISPGKHIYKFIVDGDWDKANRENRRVEVKSSGVTTNIPLTDATKISKGNLIIRYKKKAAVGVNALLYNENNLIRTISLSRGSGGYWGGESPVDASVTDYQFEVKRTWADAWNGLYTFTNFTKVLFNKDFPFYKFFFNSMITALLAGFLTIIICTMGGYVFAKKPFPGSKYVFNGLLASMMIPGMIFMVPQFALVSKFHWMNSYRGMIIPHLGNVFGLFLMKQYIETIPDSLFGAARIDGASEVQVFWNIILPLSKPIMMTLFILTFAFQWNNFLWQLIVNTPDSAYRTLPVGLALFRGQYATEWEQMIAAACFSVVPIAIIFLAAQKYFIAGMTGGAVKE